MTCTTCKTRSARKTLLGDIALRDNSQDDRGQPKPVRNQDGTLNVTIVAQRVPFGLEPLRGNEIVTARQMYSQATVRVTLNINRNWKLGTRHLIIRRNGPHAGRILNIGYIQDEEGDGRDTPILCGEGDVS